MESEEVGDACATVPQDEEEHNEEDKFEGFNCRPFGGLLKLVVDQIVVTELEGVGHGIVHDFVSAVCTADSVHSVDVLLEAVVLHHLRYRSYDRLQSYWRVESQGRSCHGSRFIELNAYFVLVYQSSALELVSEARNADYRGLCNDAFCSGSPPAVGEHAADLI